MQSQAGKLRDECVFSRLDREGGLDDFGNPVGAPAYRELLATRGDLMERAGKEKLVNGNTMTTSTGVLRIRQIDGADELTAHDRVLVRGKTYTVLGIAQHGATPRILELIIERIIHAEDRNQA